METIPITIPGTESRAKLHHDAFRGAYEINIKLKK
jgi:hypothetical protein